MLDWTISDNSISEISYASVTLQYFSLLPTVNGNTTHFEESKLFSDLLKPC